MDQKLRNHKPKQIFLLKSCFVSTHAHVTMRGYRSTCIGAHTCVCMCLLSLRIFLYSFLPFFFLRHSSAKLAKLISWSTSPRNSLVSALQGLEIQANSTLPGFFFFHTCLLRWCPELNLGPHDFSTNTLPTEPFPQENPPPSLRQAASHVAQARLRLTAQLRMTVDF